MQDIKYIHGLYVTSHYKLRLNLKYVENCEYKSSGTKRMLV